VTRSYDHAMQSGFGGAWRFHACPECNGSNQQSNMVSGIVNWWFADAEDDMCSMCRAEHEAQEWHYHEQRLVADEPQPEPETPINYDDIPF